MRGVRRTIPLYIECARPGCGALKQVRCPSDQQKHKFCSKRCAAKVTLNITGAGRKGGLEAGRRRRRAVLQRVQGLSPLEAFKLGYIRGLESKLRQIRRRYVLVRKDRAGDLVRSLSRAVAE